MKLNEARVDLYIAIAQAEVILQSNLSVAVKQGVVVAVDFISTRIEELHIRAIISSRNKFSENICTF